jgi:hypothetical protein
MPLVRATLATALPTVQQLVGELRKAVREAGAGGALDQVLQSLDALDAYGAHKSIEAEVVLTGRPSESEAKAIAAALGEGFPAEKLIAGASTPVTVDLPRPPLDLRAHVRPFGQRVAVRAGTPRPPLLVLVATQPPPFAGDDAAALERLLEDRPQVLLVGPPDADHVKAIEARVRALSWSCLKVDPAAEAGQSHQARLSAPPFDAFPDLFRAHAIAVALESLSDVLAMAVDQQQREIKVNKSVVQQKLARFGPQQKTPASPAADVTAEIKARTQRLAAEFERGAAERLQELLGQPVGSLARELEGLIQGLETLEQQPKSATIALRVPAEFEDKLNRTIRERVARHCAQDLVAMNDLFRMIGQDAERTLAQAGGPPVGAGFRFLTDERVRRMLDAYGAFQSGYKGEIPAKGFGDYFASVRKYSMFLVMGASMFGMSAMLRQYREVVFPVTLMLIAWGTYSVYTGAQRQRAETMEKELEAARTSMRADVKRILGELQKQWGTFLGQYLNEQVTGGLAELDAAVKDYQARRGGASDPEKDRLQRQVQGLEAAEKKLAGGAKTREALAASIGQVRGDMKGLMAAPARPAAPAAGLAAARAGAPAAARAAAAPAAAAAKPAGPSLAEAKAAAMADAKAKLEAMKASRAPAAAKPAKAEAEPAKAAVPPAASAAPAGSEAPPAAVVAPAPAAEAKPNAMDAFKAKMAALKAGKAAPEKAAASPSATPVDGPEAAAPAKAAEASAKPSALEAYKAKMAAMKAAKAAGAPAPAPAPEKPSAEAPGSAAAPAPPAAAPPAAAPPADAAPAAAAPAPPAPAPPPEAPAAAPAPAAAAAAPAPVPAPVPAPAPAPVDAAAVAPSDVDLDATIALPNMPRPDVERS